MLLMCTISDNALDNLDEVDRIFLKDTNFQNSLKKK